jgi:phosphoserine phosphatase
MPQLLGARPPDEAEPPLHVLRDAPFRVLVVSGGHSEANEIICDTIARETGGERAVRTGVDHLVPEAPGFNDVLERFLRG